MPDLTETSPPSPKPPRTPPVTSAVTPAVTPPVTPAAPLGSVTPATAPRAAAKDAAPSAAAPPATPSPPVAPSGVTPTTVATPTPMPAGRPAAAPPSVAPPRPPVPPVPPRPATPPPPPPPPPEPEPPSRGWLVAGIIGFVVLLALAAWQWSELQDVRRQLAAQSETAIDPIRLETLEGQLHSAQQQLQTLAEKPDVAAAAPINLGPLESRIAALENRPIPAPPPPPDDSAMRGQIADLTGQLAALGKTLGSVQSAAAQSRTQATQAQTQAAQAQTQATQAQTQATQAQADAAQAQAKAVQSQAQVAQAQSQAAQAQSQSAQAQSQSAQAQAAAAKSAQDAATQADQRAERAQRLEAVTLALSSGRALGSFDGAPASLQKFATVAPPTEASLRLSFEAAAKAAEAASDPAAGDPDLADRMWQRVQSLVTVRRGDKVLVGAPASVVLAEARQHLVAGDLAGAVAALDHLDAAAAKAMGGWRSNAQSLLDARVALAGLATSGSATP